MSTDVNALDVSKKLSLVAAAYNGGRMRLFNHPCACKEAMHREYGGHSSFVQNVRWVYRSGSRSNAEGTALATVGGRDSSLILYSLCKCTEKSNDRPKPSHFADDTFATGLDQRIKIFTVIA